jgi:hypothetical protein
MVLRSAADASVADMSFRGCGGTPADSVNAMPGVNLETHAYKSRTAEEDAVLSNENNV